MTDYNCEKCGETEGTQDTLNYIDLFSGIGGFHQALSKLDCHCILACDTDKACRKNYEMNYGLLPHPDVRKIDPEEIKEKVDIICGGFPCQAFSNAGKKRNTMNSVHFPPRCPQMPLANTSEGSNGQRVDLGQKTKTDKSGQTRIIYSRES